MRRTKILIVARREYLALVRTRAFLISMLLTPVLTGGVVVAQALLAGDRGSDEKVVVVCDRTGLLFGALEATAAADDDLYRPPYRLQACADPFLDDAGRLALSDQVRAGEVDAFAELGAGLLDGGEDEGTIYRGENLAFSSLRRWFEDLVQETVRGRRLSEAGLDPEQARLLLRPVRVEGGGLLERGEDGGIRHAGKQELILEAAIPMVVMILVFVGLMFTAPYALQTVLEEKQQRIAEVLLGSLSPFDLMLGKLLGTVSASLTVVCVYLAVGLAVAARTGHLGHIPLDVLAWIFVYEVIAVLQYGSVFIAIGSTCTEMKETQGLMMPVMIVVMVPLVFFVQVLQEPTGTLVTTLAFIPLMTPLVMPVRVAASTAVPWWEPALGAVLALGFALLCVAAAGRIFRIGILSQGRAPGLRRVIGWALRG